MSGLRTLNPLPGPHPFTPTFAFMYPTLFAAWWEPLIPVAMFLGFLLLSLMQAAWRRSQRGGDDPAWPDSEPLNPGDTSTEGRTVVRRYVRPGERQETPASPWEEELRRVLDQQSPRDPEPEPARLEDLWREPEPAAPPTRSWEEPHYPSAPPVLAPTRPEPMGSPAPDTAWVPSPPKVFFPTSAPTPVPAVPPLRRLGTMQDRAKLFLSSAGHRLGTPGAEAIPHRRKVAPELERLVTRLRDPEGARHAMLAAIIFSRPKALETQPRL